MNSHESTAPQYDTSDLTPPTCPAVDPLPGHVPIGGRDRIGRYRIDLPLGRGGMGSVYLGYDTQLERPVAVKVPNFSADQAELLERFFREARAAGRLHHANICPVYDVGEADGVHYLCMAYIEGKPLSAWVKDYAARPPRDAASLLRTLALALDEAHRMGVIHRDLKPANVMLTTRGDPVVMDFGLAREVNAPAASQTHAGTILGTPAYMSPEQARGDVAATGPGSDIYSLGVMLYELLVGRVPFQGQVLDVLVQQVRDEPAPPCSLREGIDPLLEAICLKAMAKEPSQRFLSMAEFAAALEGYLSGQGSASASVLLAGAEGLERLAAEAVVLFRTWGWEAGVGKMKRIVGKADAPAETRALLGWLRGDEAIPEESLACLRALPQHPLLIGWVLVGRAWLMNRYHRFDRAEALLREAESAAEKGDNVLRAAIAHQRGFLLYQTGRLSEAVASLRTALGLCGHDHFLTADVLTSMGLVYANKNNFPAARELMQQALLAHRRFDNDRVIARCQRNLGELYLDWGDCDRAEEIFKRGLERGLKSREERIQGIMFHYLGRTALERAEHAAEHGRAAQSRQTLARAGEWLDAAIRVHQTANRNLAEGAARRDRALAHLVAGESSQAVEQAKRAEELLREGAHAEGIARVEFIQGMLARQAGDFGSADRLLRQALGFFDRVADFLMGAKTQLELARALKAANAIGPLVSAGYVDALHRAEACRRTWLVRVIEDELFGVDREALWEHQRGRMRGYSVSADTSSLDEGTSEVATVLFLNLRQFMPFCQGMEPEEVMRTLNHMLADLEEVLEKAEAQVTAYLGGGFMALVRGSGHAWRGVDAALELLTVVEEFNRPREILGLMQVPARIAVATGPLFLGNIGTYRKMDFTAVGNAVNLASRLVRQTTERGPCITRETRELVGERFHFARADGRQLDLGSLGRREVWDVTGRRQGLSSQARR